METLVDCLVDSVFLIGEAVWNFAEFCYNGFKTCPKSKDLKIFFNSVGVKNKLGETPIIVKSSENMYVIKSPIGLSIKDYEKYKESLEAYLGYRVNMDLEGEYIKITKANIKELPSKIDYINNKYNCNSVKFDIGQSLDGVVTLDLKENPHTYVVGTTGSGKSVMTKTIMSNLISNYNENQLELYLADLKRVELNLFRNVKQCKKFVYTVEDTTELIADLLEETNRRYDLFMENEVTNIFEYNKLKGVKKLKYQVLYIEEIVMLLEDKKKNAMRLLKQLIAISRASGCYVFLTTQRPSNDVIDNVVKANINNRIVLKCEDSKNSVVALDREGAETLKGNGHGILKNGSILTEFQGYFIEDDEVKKIIKQNIKSKSDKETFNEQTLDKIGNNAYIKSESLRTVNGNKKKKKKVKKVNNINNLSFLDRI